MPGLISDYKKLGQELALGSDFDAAVANLEGVYDSFVSTGQGIEELQADGSIVLNGNQVDTADAGQQQDEMGNTEFVVSLILTPKN